MQRPNKTKLKLTVTDIDVLKAAYPDAVQQVVIIREDHTKLYAIAKAHLVIGKPIPGVTIIKPDGTVLREEDRSESMVNLPPVAVGESGDAGTADAA